MHALTTLLALATLAAPPSDLVPSQIAPIPLAERKPLDERKPGVTPVKPAASLIVGSKAPRLEVESFIKGQPLGPDNLKPGTIYVIEFWATWCGPCVAAFPHLSELAAKHKDKVVVIGVNIWEQHDPQTLERVTDFVREQGPKMGYSVAFDGKAGKAAAAWMTAADQHGIPAAFIVNREGLIAWIGHPMSMDAPLADIIASTHDLKKAAQQHTDTADAQRRTAEAAGKVQALTVTARQQMRAKEWDKAAATYEEMAKADPDNRDIYLLRTFNMFLGPAADPRRAYAMKDTLLAEEKITENAAQLGEIAWTIVKPGSAVPIKDRDYAFALAFANAANDAASGEDPLILDTLARIHFEKGDPAAALDWQDKALKAINLDPEASPDNKESLTKAHALYKKKLEEKQAEEARSKDKK